MEARFLKDALFCGMTSNAFKLGTVLTLGWFWTRLTGCLVLYRGLGVEQINFANILTVAELNSVTISPPSYLPHSNNSTYFYVVRRVNGCGYEEQTLSAAVKVSINGDGELVELQPNKIFGWRVGQINGDKIQLIWYYCPIGQKSKPVRFKIYFDGGSGQIDFESPIATINYGGQRFYSYLSEALEAGRYLFTIKAEDASGIENSTLAQLRIRLTIQSPEAIGVLSAVAI